ncbi:hypothetical protein SDIAM103S_01007 [Streptomyces diastaticus subsp. diastaticus]
MTVRRTAARTAALLAAPLALTVLGASPAGAHGTMTDPVSRVSACYAEGPERPSSDACEAAVAASGAQAFYDWNEVNLPNVAGRHREVVPDGRPSGRSRRARRGPPSPTRATAGTPPGRGRRTPRTARATRPSAGQRPRGEGRGRDRRRGEARGRRGPRGDRRRQRHPVRGDRWGGRARPRRRLPVRLRPPPRGRLPSLTPPRVPPPPPALTGRRAVAVPLAGERWRPFAGARGAAQSTTEPQVVGVAWAGSRAFATSWKAIRSMVPMATCSERSTGHRSWSSTLRTSGPSRYWLR